MTDTAPPEQVLTEAADRALKLAKDIAGAGDPWASGEVGAHMAYLAGLIRGGITNLAIAYDRGWDEGYDAAPTPLAAPADLAAVWQGLNDEGRAVVCVVSPELAGMLDAAEDHAELEVAETQAETQAEPPPHYLLQLRKALGREDRADDPAAVLGQVEKMRDILGLYRTRLLAALGIDEPLAADGVVMEQAVGVIERARRAAEAWAGTGERGVPAATVLQDLVHYLDERAA